MSEFNLRVSVATLSRVIFPHPHDGKEMLALERKTTLIKRNPLEMAVRTQPFGGAIHFLDIKPLQALIGDFLFDSQRSQDEFDFRILIRQKDWPAVRIFCLNQLQQSKDSVLETDPTRELIEEFHDTLGINVMPKQYTVQPFAILIENHPFPTENIHATGYLTVRIYLVFEVQIQDSVLALEMLKNSKKYTNDDLYQLVRYDVKNGGQGRANAVLALPLSQLIEIYHTIPPEQRGESVSFGGHLLNYNVSALFPDIPIPKYKKIKFAPKSRLQRD